MKTAADWALEMFVPLRKTEPVAWERCDKINAKVVAAIQADCLREAAEILDAGLNRGTREHIIIARDAILAKAKEISA